METRDNYNGLTDILKDLLKHGRQIGGWAYNKKVYAAVPVFLYGYTGNLIHPYRVIVRGAGTARFEHFSIKNPNIGRPVRRDGQK